MYLSCITLSPLFQQCFTFSRNGYSCQRQYAEWRSSCCGADDCRGSQETESQTIGADSR